MTRSIAREGVYLFGFLAFLLGASFVAAEFASGAMGTWLTFCPQRLRVAASQAGRRRPRRSRRRRRCRRPRGARRLRRHDAQPSRQPRSTSPRQPRPPTTPWRWHCCGWSSSSPSAGSGARCWGCSRAPPPASSGSSRGMPCSSRGSSPTACRAERCSRGSCASTSTPSWARAPPTSSTACGPDGCQGAQHTLGYTHGWVYLLVLSVVGVAAALAVFRRRDVG